jgi:hypothetical protein
VKTYNRSLDLLALAAISARDGKPLNAANFLAQAAQDGSLDKALAVINASNTRAVQASRKSTKATTQKVRATSWPFQVRASENAEQDFPGDEFRMEPEENAPREVQEADFDEMMLEEEMMAADESDEDEAEEMEEDEEVKEEATASTRTRLARALQNVAAAAKKKKKAKK